MAVTIRPIGSRAWSLAVALTITGIAAWVVLAGSPVVAQEPTFRAGVDLIAVDVQVVDRDGRPIANLGPEKFGVTIDGRPRKVVSVDLVRHAQTKTTASEDFLSGAGPIATNVWPSTDAVGRTFVLAVDIGSFDVGASRGVVAAARGFVERLQPNDLVGLYSYPLGPQLDPTVDHALVRKTLDTIVGSQSAMQSEFHLSPMEVIDITSEMPATAMRPLTQAAPARPGQPAPTALTGDESETLKTVQIRECGNEQDSRCVEAIQMEAQTLSFFYESELTRAVSGLSAVLRGLGDYPGRKTVVVLSAGMPVSDMGGRPNSGDAARTLAEDAARSNSTIYALHIDSNFLKMYSAETRQSNKAPVNRERESVMMGRLLDQFAGESGGTLIRVLVGSGEEAFDRVLLETSAYYLLGVAPADSDRDGRTHTLKVKVDQRGATIRNRNLVLVPKKHI